MKILRLGISVVALLIVGIGVGWAFARTAVAPTVPSVAGISAEVATVPARAPVSADVAADDHSFVPPTGRAADAKEYTAGVRRIMTATSADGVHFTPTGRILSDRANVPDLVVDDDGAIRVYYIGQGIVPGQEENTVLAISHDNGVTWTYRTLTYVGFPSRREPSDPDVVRLSDGTYRMYFTYSATPSKLGIAYADSPDGLTFTFGGSSFVTTDHAVDSSTVYFNGVWHMYSGRESQPVQRHATSADGATFALSKEVDVRLDEGYYISDEVAEGSVLRLYAFSFAKGNARSFTSPDGITWTADDVALTADDATTLGTGFLQDVNVVRLPDGTYFMAYVTGLPTE